MSLSSLQLDAFHAVARAASFSAAAKTLAITQSALSQRVLNLEEELGTTLFVREPSGVRLTEVGERLLRYCQAKENLEVELLTGLKPEFRSQVTGVVRVAAFSSVTKSVVLPIVAAVVREHPRLAVEVSSAELKDLPGILLSGRADFVFSTSTVDRQGVESHLVGYETNVLVEPSSRKFREDVMLDHDPDDSTTRDFFRQQGKKAPAYRRDFLDEIDSILEGVKSGMGRAVAPVHLVRSMKGVEVVSGFKPLKVPVYLSHYTQAYYTRLQEILADRFKSEVSKGLEA